VAVFLLFSMLTVYCFFSWGFTVANGFPPNPDAVKFLVLNALRVPLHTLQTSPVLSLVFVAVVVTTAFGMTWMMARLSRRSEWKPRRSIAVTVSALLLVAVSAPYAEANVSPVAVASQLVDRLNVLSDDLTSDPELADTFMPARPYAVAPDFKPRGPVIILLVESLRRDLIEVEPSPIPFLKGVLQNEGVFFDKAYATASHSNYADVAFWYSRYPMRTLDLQTYQTGSPQRGTSLFSIVRMHGYATAYISSQNEFWGGMVNWLQGEAEYFFHSEDYGGRTWFNKDDKKGIAKLIKRGVATAGKIEDSETLQIAQQWIGGLNGRRDFLLAMNLQNTHFSYVVPPNGAEPYKPDNLDFATIYYRWPKEHKEAVRNRYLNAVFNVDRMLGDFADYLKANGLWDDTTFVVVGDSGEAFYEHGFGNHSGPMYDEVMRTFAMIKPPRGTSLVHGTHERAISHLDIPPTVLTLAGIPVPGSFQGRSILEPGARPPIFMHTNAIVKQHGVVDWPWKLLHTYFPYHRVELYDLDSDPQERRNLSVQRTDVRDRLVATLDDWVKRQLLYYRSPEYFTRLDPPR
jgi:arylsulfatase A-like enzyme